MSRQSQYAGWLHGHDGDAGGIGTLIRHYIRLVPGRVMRTPGADAIGFACVPERLRRQRRGRDRPRAGAEPGCRRSWAGRPAGLAESGWKRPKTWPGTPRQRRASVPSRSGDAASGRLSRGESGSTVRARGFVSGNQERAGVCKTSRQFENCSINVAGNQRTVPSAFEPLL